MDGEARQLPPEPGEAEEAILRAAGMWPPDMHGYVTDPLLQEKRHWTRALALACREGIALTERVRVHLGDVLAMLRSLPAASVHCVVTSPPYWGLRDYGIPQSLWPEVTFCPMSGVPSVVIPEMSCALGLEDDLLAFVGHLVLVFREVARVLRPDGVCWLNLGDSYATGTQTDRQPSKTPSDGRDGRAAHKPAGWTNRCQGTRRSPAGLAPKNLLLAPHRVALALQADGWIVRQDNIWGKPSPLPESVTDRSTRAHEYVFQLVRAEKYFYDALAVSEPCTAPQANTEADRARAFSRRRATVVTPYQGPVTTASRNRARREDGSRGRRDHRGSSVPWAGTRRNLRSVWTIASQPFRGAHFATFPSELPRRCILASTSEIGCCPSCGTPWRRLVSRETTPDRPGRRERPAAADALADAHGSDQRAGKRACVVVETVGWTLPCRCPLRRPVPCVVLDPFGGSGTTAEAAVELGREAVLIDAQPKYFPLMQQRMAETIERASKSERAQRKPRCDEQIALPLHEIAVEAPR